MNKIKCYTSDYNGESEYAKIIRVYKDFGNLTDWHDNQLIFKVWQYRSYDGAYVEKIYNICTFTGTSTPRVCFSCLSDKNVVPNFNCKIAEFDEYCDVYVKGWYTGVPVNVQILHVSLEDKFMFYFLGNFSHNLMNGVEADSNPHVFQSFTPTYKTGVSENSNFTNVITKRGCCVHINQCLSVDTYGNDVEIYKLSSEFTPKKAIFQGILP